jgi:putative SOS response-associated peptidase YedK
MCARYTMGEVSAQELVAQLGLDAEPPPLEPHYNIAPTQRAPIVVQSRDGRRHLGLARFGLVPRWAEDLKIGAQLLNARAETVASKPAFREAFARRRCLVVADGFYEWRLEGGVKVPTWFHLPDRRLIAFAGLWDTWVEPSRRESLRAVRAHRADEGLASDVAAGDRVTSFAILTRDAEGPVQAVHDRMPVVLRPQDYASWLDRGVVDAALARRVLEHDRGAELEGHVVSRRVNSVRNDDPTLIEPVALAASPAESDRPSRKPFA